MNAVITVCMITITVALILLISAMIFILKEVRRLNSIAERLMIQLEKDITPVISNLNKVTEDVATVTGTVRSQVERVDLTADHISKDLMALVEACTKTGYLLHDAVADPLIDIAAFIKGCTRGLKFFFMNKKR